MAVVRIGIVGAGARGSWAQAAHVPALQCEALQPLAEFSALSTSSMETARVAGTAFGVDDKYCFGDASTLASSPDVDVVTVAVNVAQHLEPVQAAIAAGKSVYCEWPLGKSTAEAESMASAAAKAHDSSGARLHTFIGTQARYSPSVLKMRELLASGAIGRPLSSRVVCCVADAGIHAQEKNRYVETPGSGASFFIIFGGHTLDMVLSVLGPLESLAVQASVLQPSVVFRDTGAALTKTLPDHWLISARTQSQIDVSLELDSTRRASDCEFRFEVRGTLGALRIVTPVAPMGSAISEHSLTLDLFASDADDAALESTEVVSASSNPVRGPAANVAGLYAAIARDVQQQQYTVPDFAHAVRLHQLIDDITAAAQSGQRAEANGKWPTQF